jgi:pyruvate formate lyase activating enzyme
MPSSAANVANAISRERIESFVFHGFVPLTMIDYPGKLAFTAYTMGCNFRCPVCHNPELALSKEEELPSYSVRFLLDWLCERTGWIDGVCVTGGEPLLFPEIAGVLRCFKDAGLDVKLDTNGSFPERLAECLRAGLVDYVAMDVKAPLTEEGYGCATGISMQKWLPKLRDSIRVIRDSGVDYEFRTICIPGIHTPDDIAAIARETSPCRRHILRAFRPQNTLDPECMKIAAPLDAQMNEYLNAARQYLDKDHCWVG